jgi:hypothetical protein
MAMMSDVGLPAAHIRAQVAAALDVLSKQLDGTVRVGNSTRARARPMFVCPTGREP